MKKIVILIPFFWFSCNSQNLDNILTKLNSQCDLLPRFNSSEWIIERNGEGTLLGIKRINKEHEYLDINISDSPILGYYTEITAEHHLLLRIRDCDTIMFYSIDRGDTTFIKGYYQHLFYSQKLNRGQQRYFRRNLDSLVQIRGGNLPQLPETNEPLR